MWNGATTNFSNVAGGIGDVAGSLKYFMIGTFVIGGGVLLMIAYSVASGQQNVASIIKAAKPV